MHDLVKIGLGSVAGGLGVAGLALYAASVVHNAKENDYKEKIQHLDHVPTVILRSTEKCAESGFSKNACDCSFNQKAKLNAETNITLSYPSEEECKKNHASYNVQTHKVPVVHRVGNSSIVTNVNSTRYYPDVVAIQAEKNNICDAVPLYSGKNPNEAVRYDGKKFALDSL